MERSLLFTLKVDLFCCFVDFIGLLIFMFKGFPLSPTNSVPDGPINWMTQRVSIVLNVHKCIEDIIN